MARIWGGGLSDEDSPLLENLMITEDNEADSYLIGYEILALISYHLELSKNNVIPKQESVELLSALLNLYGNKPTNVKGFEDVHSFVDSEINRATSYGSDLRIFLSRNDQSHFDIRSFYLDQLLEMGQNLVQVSGTIKSRFENAEGFMAGYTHYRQAMPVSFKTYFDYLSGVFADLAEDCLLLYGKLSVSSPLGYGSGYGSPVPVDMEQVGKSLGFGGYYRNPMKGSFYRGLDDAEISFVLSKIMLSISRISQDLIMYSSDEFSFLELPKGYTTGSSLMPNKRNPDFLEMLQGYAAEASGTLFTTFAVLANKGSGYHRELQLSKDKTISFSIRTIKILKALIPLFEGINIDSSKARKLLKNPTYATMAAYEKFRAEGKWKEAYRFIGTRLKDGEPVTEYSPDSYVGTNPKQLQDLQKRIHGLILLRKNLELELVKTTKDFIKIKNA